MTSTESFRAARDLLLAHREDQDGAVRAWRPPTFEHFNWALDWFDAIARDNERPALRVVDDAGVEERVTFRALAERSDRVANLLRERGARRGDRLLLMLPNVAPLWETFLGAMKLGVVVVPATTQLTAADVADRVGRGGIRFVVTDAEGAARVDAVAAEARAGVERLITGPARDGWTSLEDAARMPSRFEPDGPTPADDTMLLYFTSGTTASPKLVLHTHRSYPVGHLSTMYWIGLREGDVHWNISSPGWAKHAWSSVFAPWNAGATVFALDYARFDARRVLETIVRCGVTTLCAPPTVWRMLVGEDLAAYPVRLREVVGAGEPLNPEVIERVRRAWGLTIRDGYGQTETTAQIGNGPGQPVKPGSMGRPLPGYRVALLDADGREAADGEVALRLDPPPVGLMREYLDDAPRTAEAMRDGYYHTGDVARTDADGYVTFVGRTDDVFKSSDYRISPFELESVLIEHPAIGEAAVVPSPDATRLSVPKAFVSLRGDAAPSREAALALFRFSRERLAAYKRVRRVEFSTLPKTISGKIRRVELRALVEARRAPDPGGERRAPNEYWEQDFPELRGASAAGAPPIDEPEPA